MKGGGLLAIYLGYRLSQMEPGQETHPIQAMLFLFGTLGLIVAFTHLLMWNDLRRARRPFRQPSRGYRDRLDL